MIKKMYPLKRKIKSIFTPFYIAIVVVFLAVAWFYPIQESKAVFNSMPAEPGAKPSVAWPAFGQSALGIKGYGVVETNGEQKAAPTASIAKIFTAVAVLKKHPLQPGQQGPIITITQEDVDSYNSYYTQGGSLAAISLGEKITERQALEAMLLPSANNMADTLARWAFGSIDNYNSYINSLNSSLGLKNTHIVGASGFKPGTVSSASDLVKIGQVALANPVLAAIVSEPYAYVPVAGQIHNTNWLLGTNNINGIKTGNTDEAGGCYLFSSLRTIQGKNVTIIGAVMSAPDLTSALTAGREMAASVDSGFMSKLSLPKGQEIGYYKLAWGEKVPIATGANINLVGWGDNRANLNYYASDENGLKKDQNVGRFYATTGFDTASSPIVANQSSNSPPWRWRLYQRYL